jgi:SAM-dependent methyltransferase
MATSRYVDGEYLQRNPGWHSDDSPWKAEHILKMIARNSLAPRTIAEVGCGAGEILRRVQAGLGPDVRLVGFDVSPQALALCSPKANERLRFELGTLEAQGDVTFDLLLLIDVVEHVENCAQFLRDMRTRARHVILHIPLDLSAQGVLREEPLIATRRQVGHIHYFTKGLALEALKEAGYRIVDSFYTGGAIDLPAKTVRTWVASWPRRLFFSINKDLCARLLGGFSLLILVEPRDTRPQD